MNVLTTIRKLPLGLFFVGIMACWTMYCLCLLKQNLSVTKYSISYLRTKRLFVDRSKLRSKQTEEVRHIAYLKVHKTGSSTVSNIFLRFGEDRNLNFVFPKYRGFFYRNVISLNESINSKNVLPPPKNKTYDILCSHVVYNRTAWAGMMPRDTFYVASVRDPFDQFVSSLQYFNPYYVMNISNKNPMSKFLENPEMYEWKEFGSFTNNRMAFEFGFPRSVFLNRNKTLIFYYLKKLHREFKVVVVLEYFDESLVLLKRYLNWNLLDILYLEQNKNLKKEEPHRKIISQARDRENYKKWAILDYALYDFFYNRLWYQIQMEGTGFYRELLHFKNIRKRLIDFCRNFHHTHNTQIMHVDKTQWNDDFVVTTQHCNLMDKSELVYFAEVYRRQYPNGSL